MDLLIIPILFIIGIIVLLVFLISKANNYSNNQGKTYIDNNGYRRFKDSNKLVHRYVMEKKLGRKLKYGEIVHHIDRNKLNNLPENLEVFANQDEHQEHHNKTDWLFSLSKSFSRRFRFKIW
jgi:hypothetical protein